MTNIFICNRLQPFNIGQSSATNNVINSCKINSYSLTLFIYTIVYPTIFAGFYGPLLDTLTRSLG